MSDYNKFYRAYKYMTDLLENDYTYNLIRQCMHDADKGEDSHNGKIREYVIDLAWVAAIEDTLPYIQKAIDEQRRYFTHTENLVRIENARKINSESIKHLARHTNLITKVENDVIMPEKILTNEVEESFDIYENRVLMTLIRKTLRFIDKKYDVLKNTDNKSCNELNIARHIEFYDNKIGFELKYKNENNYVLSDNIKNIANVAQLSDFDRIRRLRLVLNEFLSMKLLKDISNQAEVHSPLIQTNLLKKNRNFKKIVELWNYLESYKDKGYEISEYEYNGKINNQIQNDMYLVMAFEHFMMNVATNPDFRKMLQHRYEIENTKNAESLARTEKNIEAKFKAQIEAVKKEEMQLRICEVKEKERKISELSNKIKKLESKISAKDIKIKSQEEHISTLEKSIIEDKEEYNSQITHLNEREKELKATIDEYCKAIDNQAQIIKEKENQVFKLSASIEQERNEFAEQQNSLKKEYDEKLKAVEKDYFEKLQEINKKFLIEKEKIEKSIDKRIEAIKKLSDSQYITKTKELQKSVKKEIKKSEKKANQKISEIKSEYKLLKNYSEAIQLDYTTGFSELIFLYTQQLAEEKYEGISDKIRELSQAIKSIIMIYENKKIILLTNNRNALKIIKKYQTSEKITNILVDILKIINLKNNTPTMITCSECYYDYAKAFSNMVSDKFSVTPEILCNKELKTNKMLAVYFSNNK
ncbi:MAG: hypothetical protein MJ089_06350 [Ruminococcus sp.]|nr:hypothetical protein [Ruminococcus sp.]